MSLMRTLLATVSIVLVSAASAPVSADHHATDAGKAKVPAFKYDGKVHEKGRYNVQVEMGADSVQIVLSKDGAEVVRELAIVREAKGNVKRARTSVAVIAKDENRIRVTVRHGTSRYIAFFESGS